MKKNYLFQKYFIASICILFCNYYSQAQNTFPATGSAGIGTTTPNASSILEMVSTTKGLLVPRMNKTQRDNIAVTPPTGLLIYQTNNSPGFYYFDGSLWKAVVQKAKGWSLTGNAGTDPSINFIGTTDGQSLIFKINNQKSGYLDYIKGNTGFGYQTLIANTFGGYNTANGYQALVANTGGSANLANGVQALYSNTTGSSNTAAGASTLFYNTTGFSNVAVGTNALFNNTIGHNNIAVGDSALYNQNGGSGYNIAVGSKALYNTTGSSNTAAGANTLFNNTTGYSNVAVGTNALFNNTNGRNNIAVGDSALYNQNGGNGYNTAVGSKALYTTTVGGSNTATGYQALYFNNIGSFNTALGNSALLNNTTGGSNTASGKDALYNNMDGDFNTGFGQEVLLSNVSGNFNTAIGAFSTANNSSYSNSSGFGANSFLTASNQVRVGDNAVTSIGGYQSWTTLPSDKRVKKNIKENVPGLAFINKLKPVTYNIDISAIEKIVQRPVIKNKDGKIIQPSQQELDSRKAKEQIVFTGFLAQDVEAAATSLNYDFSGVDKPKNDKDLYGLRYSDFVMPLVKAVQELSATNDSLKKQNDAQQTINIDLQNRLAKLEAMMNSKQSSAFSSQQKLSTVNGQPSTALAQNIPNPFSNTTTINYSLPQNFKTAQIIVIDELGNTIKIFNLSGTGKGTINFSSPFRVGASYQYSLLIDGKLIDTKQMVLAK